MKALFLLEPFKMEFRDIPKPKIEDYDDILVKIIITGICGSDIHMFLGESEEIATMRRAAEKEHLSKEQIGQMFFGTAAALFGVE